jgi:hypothetical protein
LNGPRPLDVWFAERASNRPKAAFVIAIIDRNMFALIADVFIMILKTLFATQTVKNIAVNAHLIAVNVILIIQIAILFRLIITAVFVTITE